MLQVRILNMYICMSLMCFPIYNKNFKLLILTLKPMYNYIPLESGNLVMNDGDKSGYVKVLH